MSEGNLIRTSLSELVSTIELLDRLGVTPQNFEALRKASSWQQTIVAAVLRGDQYLLNLLALEIPAKKAGFSAKEITTLAGENDESLLRNFRNVLLGDAEIKPVEFWRTLNDLWIQIPALKRPTLEELRRQFPWIKSIERDASPEEAVTLRLGTVLRSNEDYIPGSEYERRLASHENSLHGYQQAVWLVEHQEEFPALKPLLGNVYVDFPGIKVVNAAGYQYFPCLFEYGERWFLLWLWSSRNLNRRGRVASK